MSDADLIRYLHAELGDDERAVIDARIASAPAVAERLRTLRHREARLSSLFGSVDPTTSQVAASAESIRGSMRDAAGPRAAASRDVASRDVASRDVASRDVASRDVASRGTGRPSFRPRVLTHEHWWQRVPRPLQAAAVVTLLLGGVLLVEPARAWVIDGVRAIGEAMGLIGSEPAERPAEDETVVETETQATGADARFSFAWSGDRFAIHAGSGAQGRQAVQGTIVVRRGEPGRVTAEAVAAPDATFTVRPDGIAVHGSDDPRALFIVTVPQDVQTIVLQYESASRSYDLAPDGTELRLSLPPF